MPRTARSTAKDSRSARPTRPEAGRTRINLSLQAKTVAEARSLGLNLSRIADATIAEAVRQEKQRRWLAENQQALDAFNARILRDGPWNKDLLSF